MEYKTSKLTVLEELELIKSIIPSANNLPENLEILRKMGLVEEDIKEILRGEFVMVFESIKNPQTGEKILAGPCRITIDKQKADEPQQIYINSQPMAEFFANPYPRPKPQRTKEDLEAENEILHHQIKDFQERYDDIWDYCKNLERKFQEREEKSRN